MAIRKAGDLFGSQLTTRAVYLFGAVLVLIGLIFISTGVPMVRMEIGWAEMIAGSVAASAGCVILVLGVFLARLESLQDALDRLSLAAIETPVERDPEPVPVPAREVEDQPSRFAALHPLAPALKRPEPAPVAAVRPEPALPVPPPLMEEVPEAVPAPSPLLEDGAPALVQAEEQASHSPAVEPVVAREARQRSSFLASILAKRAIPGMPWRETDPDPAPAGGAEASALPLPEQVAAPTPLRRTVVDLSSGWNDEGHEPEALPTPGPPHPMPMEPEPEPEPDDHHAEGMHEDDVSADEARSADIHAFAPKAEPNPAQPVVVGRYNAGAASYVMYSNGMIEVETEQGTHQFASMQELKAFIERRDSAARAY